MSLILLAGGLYACTNVLDVPVPLEVVLQTGRSAWRDDACDLDGPVHIRTARRDEEPRLLVVSGRHRRTCREVHGHPG